MGVALENKWQRKIILNISDEHPDGRGISIDIVQQSVDIKQAYQQLFGYDNTTLRGHTLSIQKIPNTADNSYRASPPPAYRPVKITDQFGKQRLYYLPQTLKFQAQFGQSVNEYNLNLLTVFKKYDINPDTYSTIDGKDSIDPNKSENVYLVLRDGKKNQVFFDEYEWHSVDNPFVNKHQLLNCDDYRLAIDGHYYCKSPNTSPPVIGKIQTDYYELINRQTGQTFQATIQTQSGNIVDNDNSFQFTSDTDLANRFARRKLF